MKIFAVGIDEKLPIKESPISPDAVTLAPTPIITVEKKRTSYKNYVMCVGALFFMLLSATIVSKLLYYRPNDSGLPWFEMKHRMGCSHCMNAGIMQSFNPQRSLIVSENSNNAPAASAAQAEQPQTSGQAAYDTSSQRLELGSSVGLPQIVDSRIDFLRKIIPKIKDQAEKSGIEGVMQLKLLQVDSYEPKQPLDGLDERQFQPRINEPKPADFLAPSRSVLLPDLSHWNAADNDESQMPANQFFGSQQDDKVKSGSMLILGPFLQPQQLQLLTSTSDDNNNIVWSTSAQLRLLDLGQQISKQQQWNYPWQWPIPTYNKNNNEKIAEWRSIQWPNNHLPTSVLQQNPLSTWETWQDSIQTGDNLQNNIQNGANNQWAQNGWQGQGQQEQFLSPYSQTLQGSMDQNQYQNNNDWNIQRANIADNLDGRMTQAVFPNDNTNNVYNNIANDYWTRYWRNMKPQSQQRSIANTGQLLEVTESAMQQTQDRSPESQQREVHEMQSQINTLSNEAFQQSPSVPVVSSGLDDNVSRTVAPFVFDSESWKKTENLVVKPLTDNQEQLPLLHQERRQLPIHSVEGDINGSRTGLKLTDDDFNKNTQSVPISDISHGLSNPMLFQIDDPSSQSAHMDESLIK